MIPQGTGTGHPRCFSPMQAFRQLPLPKASASQSGFHPAYALRSRMSRRNSLHYSIFIFQVHVQFNRSGNKNGRFASDHFYRTFSVFKYAFCSLVILKLSTLFWIVLLCTHGASLFSSRYGRTDLYCFARAVAKYHAIIILT